MHPAAETSLTPAQWLRASRPGLPSVAARQRLEVESLHLEGITLLLHRGQTRRGDLSILRRRHA